MALSEKDRLNLFPLASIQRDEDMRNAVVWSFFLNSCSKLNRSEDRGKISGKMTFLESIQKSVYKKQEDTNTDLTNLFEKMKMFGLNYNNDNWSVPYKKGDIEWDPKPSSGRVVSINILQAMYQDHKQGYDSNAACGYELMMEPYGRSPIKGLENNLTIEIDKKKGIMG